MKNTSTMNTEDDRSTTTILTIHDVNETARRAIQFCGSGMVVAFVTVITNIYDGNFLSALLVSGLIAALGIMIVINKKGNPRIAKFGLVILLNGFLTLITFAEGLNSASTSYFLPVLFAIPFFIDNNSTSRLELSLFFSITFISFACCILFCDKTSSWEHISSVVFHRMFITNCICSFVLCGIFGYLSIYLERKYANALLMQSKKTQEAMHSRTKFLSSMGHELRTPLNGIIGATNLLRGEETLYEQKEYLDILKYCSDHMLGLVNDILDFNKIEAGQLNLHPIECNIKKLLVQSTLPFYNRFEEKKLELKVQVDEQLDQLVLIDDLRLVQVINNLLSNALKFTETGFVKLIAKQEHIIDNLVTIHFEIHDSGIGIKEADQEKIFGSFWQVYNETTRKYAGTGLGLTICQRLLELMDSSLAVKSEEGKGSKFYFKITLPAIAPRKATVSVVEKVNNDLEGIRILLAEDNLINMMIAKKFLQDKKAALTTAQNGEEALDCLKKNDSIDIVLLDLEMPVMDGYSAVVEIRKKYPQIPVLAFTAALMDQEMLQRLLNLGFSDCILKPFQPLDFYAKVRKYAVPLLEEAS